MDMDPYTPEQEYIYFIGSPRPPSAYDIHLHKVSLPFFDQR